MTQSPTRVLISAFFCIAYIICCSWTVMVFSNRRTSSSMLDDFFIYVSAEIKAMDVNSHISANQRQQSIRGRCCPEARWVEVFHGFMLVVYTWCETLLSCSHGVFHVHHPFFCVLGQVGDGVQVLFHSLHLLVGVWEVPHHVIRHAACCWTVHPLERTTEKD